MGWQINENNVVKNFHEINWKFSILVTNTQAIHRKRPSMHLKMTLTKRQNMWHCRVTFRFHVEFASAIKYNRTLLNVTTQKLYFLELNTDFSKYRNVSHSFTVKHI